MKVSEMNPTQKLAWRNQKKRDLLQWQRDEIERVRAKGLIYVNFTCLQTLEEAEADLAKAEAKLEKEIKDAESRAASCC